MCVSIVAITHANTSSSRKTCAYGYNYTRQVGSTAGSEVVKADSVLRQYINRIKEMNRRVNAIVVEVNSEELLDLCITVGDHSNLHAYVYARIGYSYAFGDVCVLSSVLRCRECVCMYV